MNDISQLTIHLGQLESGKWVAATGSSPFFCVEADSENAVKALAKEAIGFYVSVLKKHDGTLPAHKIEQPFTRTITAGELVAA